MYNTLQVVPSKALLLPNGTTASIFSAYTPGQKVVVRGWTWQKVDHKGSMTQGLCRVPAKTKEEAEEFAAAYAEKFGFTVLDTKES